MKIDVLRYLLTISLIVLSSCRTRGDIKRNQEISVLRDSVSAVQVIHADNVQAIEELRLSHEELKGKIEKIEYLSSQRIDDLTNEIEKLRQEISKKLGKVKNKIASQLVESKEIKKLKLDDRYKMARKLHLAKKFDKAERYYLTMRGSRSRWYDERVRFFLGLLYHEKASYKQAVIALQEFIEKYPKSKNIPAAILIQGDSFISLNQKKEASVFFKDLIARFPNSKEARQARVRLNAL